MMINVLFFTFIEKYVVAMRCYGYCSLVRVAELPTSENPRLKDMAYNLRPNSACSLSWSKKIHFRPLAPGLMVNCVDLMDSDDRTTPYLKPM